MRVSTPVHHFAISTDINQLISKDLPWRQRELALDAAFPSRSDFILAVVDAPTPELCKSSKAALLQQLQGQKALFHAIRQQGGSPFFERNGLCSCRLRRPETDRPGPGGRARSLIAILAAGPQSARLEPGDVAWPVLGVEKGRVGLDETVRPMTMAADTVESVLAKKPVNFSWQALAERAAPAARSAAG